MCLHVPILYVGPPVRNESLIQMWLEFFFFNFKMSSEISMFYCGDKIIFSNCYVVS